MKSGKDYTNNTRSLTKREITHTEKKVELKNTINAVKMQ